jgi:hypothetical protein
MLASVLILAASLIQYSNNDAVSSAEHHRCGLEVAELYRKMNALPKDQLEGQLLALGEEYANILNGYALNHERVDFLVAKLDKPEKYPMGAFERAGVQIRVSASTFWPEMLMFLLVLSSLLITVFYVLPSAALAP